MKLTGFLLASIVASTTTASFLGDFTHTFGSAASAVSQLAHDMLGSDARIKFPSTHSSKKRAIVRPFSPNDWNKLISSFDVWNTNVPCDSNSPLTVPTDLFLHYSRSLSDAPFYDELSKAVERLDDAPWRKCFRYVKLIDAKLTAEQDVYEPTKSKTMKNFNQGPQMQFLRLVATLGNAGYELFYLLEPDTTPLRSDWLVSLQNIIQRERPFMIVGSTYSGSKWNAFRDELPESLLHHINGNAIYNISSSTFQQFVNAMIVEGVGHSSFDLRFAEMLLQKTGGDVEALPRQGYVNAGEFENHAASILVDGTLDDNVLFVHGGKTVSAWPKSEDLALLVSHWDNVPNADETLDSFVTAEHPFTSASILMYGRDKAQMFDDENVKGVPRKYASAKYDICEVDAAGNAKWFMISNTNHRVLDGTIPVNGKKPLLQFLSTPSGWDVHPMRIPYNTELAREYCKEALRTGQPPSAIQYVEYVKEHAPETYEYVDIAKYGQLNAFEEIKANGSPRRLTINSRFLEAANHTSCKQLKRKACIKNAECSYAWRKKFCYVNDCTERLTKFSCNIGNDCSWSNDDKTCSIKTKTPTKEPTQFPTNAPTNAPTTRAPTTPTPTGAPTTSAPTAGGCAAFSTFTKCNRNGCFWSRKARSCLDDVCANRYGSYCKKKNYFLNDLGCVLDGSACQDQTCGDIKNRLECSIKDTCSWQGKACAVRTAQPTQAPTSSALNCNSITSSKTCWAQSGCFYRDRKHGCLSDRCEFYGATRCRKIDGCTLERGTCRPAVCADFKRNKYACVGEKHGLHCSWAGKTCIEYIND